MTGEDGRMPEAQGCKNAAEQELLQLEALLLARAYWYELAAKLLGGTPDDAILEAALSETTRDIVEEFSDESDELVAFAAFLSRLRERDFGSLLEDARDEHTRVFIGPAALPASPYESPYLGSHDMALFQENTLEVRRAYESAGLRPRRVQAVPDDHIAMMCSFMAAMSARALDAFLGGNVESLGHVLMHQRAFSESHMGSWLDTFAASVRNSEAGDRAVLYPQLLEAVSAFVKADRSFLAESSYWASEQGHVDGRELAEELKSAADALCRIKDLAPLGAADFEMTSIDE